MTRAIKYYEVLFKSVPHALTYQSTASIPIGSLIKTTLNKKSAHGIVLRKGKKSAFPCLDIQEVLIKEAVSPLQLNLASWMSEYYFAPLSKCVALFVPPVIWNAKRQPKRDKNGELVNPDKDHPSKPYHGEPLTREQKKVLKELCHSKGIPRLEDSLGMTNWFLLHGITGSGKTEIYLQLIKKMIQQDQQTVLLVPEIALTSELIRHFAGHFPDQISIIHSRISEGARLQSWHRICDGKTKLILGSRSALFTPWRNLGAIIMDEEHEWTYKSEQTPRYQTRTVAEKIVALHSSPHEPNKPNRRNEPSPFLLLGSATPSIETYYRSLSVISSPILSFRPEQRRLLRGAKWRNLASVEIRDLSTRPPPEQSRLGRDDRYSLLSLPSRATSEALPAVTVVDLRQEYQKKNMSMISDSLASAITDRLLKKEQVILFLNKRGAASCVICRDCGFTPRCKRCDLAMTYHLKLNRRMEPLKNSFSRALGRRERCVPERRDLRSGSRSKGQHNKNLSSNFYGAEHLPSLGDALHRPSEGGPSELIAYPSRKDVFQRFHDPPPDGLLCHSCGSSEPTPLQCPVCKSLAIRYVGSGTQKLHVQLQSLFPTARILRADKDTASARHAFERIYQKMWNQEADILLGTQMITKGLDLPNVTLVGIVIADIGLHIPDFRASERVFQLLTQVSGRSGRHKPGEVIIQTYQPEHPAIQAAAKHDYKGFYEQEIHHREQFFYPPFSKMIRLTFAHKDPKKAEDEAKRMFEFLKNSFSRAFGDALRRSSEGRPSSVRPEVASGRVACPSRKAVFQKFPSIDLSPHYIPKLHNKWIWNILIRGKDPRNALENLTTKNAWPAIRSLGEGWVINVDPV